MKAKLPNKSEQKEEVKQVVGLDLGNSCIRIAYNIKQIDLRTTLLLENNNVYINKRATPLCLTDFLMFLGKKFDDPSFQRVIKYYNYGFSKGTNQNILLQSNSKAFGEQFYTQLPVSLLIKAFFLTNPILKFLTLSQESFRLVVTLFEGKLNPYRQALSTCLSLGGISNFCLVNSSVCLAANYLKANPKERDDTEVVCVIDFGAQGLTFSGYKLYHMQTGIVQTLFYQISPFGGTTLTTCLVDYVTGQLIKEKGMDINKNGLLMHRMRLLCQEAKHTLSSNDHAFVRLDGLPDILVYGCQVFLPQFQQSIFQVIRQNIEMIAVALKGLQCRVSKIIMNGGSCRIPLFGKLLSKVVQKQKLVFADHDELRRGLLLMKTEGVHVIDICPFDLRLEGDEKLKINLIKKGQALPLRKKQTLKFPSGQLTQSLRFYQNEELVATCFIPERPRENTFSLYVEVDHNKLLNIFATTSQGLIKMNCNLMELPREDYVRYQELISKADYHIEND